MPQYYNSVLRSNRLILVGVTFSLCYWVCFFVQYFQVSHWLSSLSTFGITPLSLLLFLFIGPVIWHENARVYFQHKSSLFRHRLTLDLSLSSALLYPFYPRILVRMLSFLPLRLLYFAVVQAVYTLGEIFLLPCFLFVPFRKFWLFSFQIIITNTQREFEKRFLDLKSYQPPDAKLLNPQTFRRFTNVLFSSEPEEFWEEMRRFTAYDPLFQRLLRLSLRLLDWLPSRQTLKTLHFAERIDHYLPSQLTGISKSVFVTYFILKTLHFPPGSAKKLIRFGLDVTLADLEHEASMCDLSEQSLTPKRLKLKQSLISSLTEQVLSSDPQDLSQIPLKVEEALQLKSQGVRWTNAQCRRVYLHRVSMIPGMLKLFRASADYSPERSARLAYDIRHRARETSRAMMMDPDEVATLKLRDLTKYDTTEGPSFEWLCAVMVKRGYQGDAIFTFIEASACQTNEAINGFFQRFNPKW